MNTISLPLLCVVIAGGIMIAGCSAQPKSPEISVQGVTLKSLSFGGLSLDVTLQVTNPNPFGLTLDSLTFDVYYQDGSDWVYLSHGEKKGITVNPGENEITVPVTVDNAELLRSLAGFITSGEVTVQVRGTASVDLHGLIVPIPFTHTSTVKR
jgi:LEA14-like dessication related protein